jgi:hypothetical protein
MEYFNKYLYYKEIGMKDKAKEAVENFVKSFESHTEKELWTTEYLVKLENDSNGRIRNELFEEIIFPVLWAGYNKKDIKSMIYLAKLSQNYYQNNNIFKKMDYKTDLQIIKEAYELEPDNNDIIDLYLEIMIQWISYAIHEYPSGILIANNGATKEQCEGLLAEIPLLNKLDRHKKYSEYIKDYEHKIKEDMKGYDNEIE